MEDTIAAIATSVGVSAINIIKVSGSKAIEITNSIFKGKDLRMVEPFTINHGFIMDENDKVDEVLVSVFKAPKSYTGEDVIEINTHGGIACTNKILELLLTHGCRLAQPGEFLKRSFLNGKRDLIEAESIGDLIEAKTTGARKMAMQGITGQLSNMIKELREKLVTIISNIEVNIDYPEYDDAIVYTNELLDKNIIEIKEALSKILKESEKGKIIKDGINVGIIGKPNVGKSSLLNKLLNEDKAIVTDIEGTTRDIVEGQIVINGITLNLIDTAGIRETDNIVEQIGVNKSKEIIEKSDLIIAMFDGSRPLSDEDEEILNNIKDKKVIIIINKTDLKQEIDLNKFDKNNIVQISIKNEEGINTLTDKIKEMFNLNEIENSDYTYLSNSRQIAIIKNCVSLSEEIYEANKNKVDVDLIQIDIQRLWEMLGELIGITYKEEFIDEMFKRFCLGK